ncbi:flagellar assembly protein FliW [Simkania negevensis]|uniref:Flagellar assembly factor FliW n=1 Tax=Simkania negevensis TaxID=83561 RepID=A0ABS3AT33_9BACT|nr:flagellar assembly protein FliW [Simkania negevensis]
MQPLQTQMQSNLEEGKIFHYSKSIHFPEGIPAFEEIQEFVLISNEEEAPFIWLQAVKPETLAFITIDPFLIYDQYLPDISEEDVEQLKIKSVEDVLILSIVNMKNNKERGITANLVSPIVINWKERMGKQVILKNYNLYSVQHKIR